MATGSARGIRVGSGNGDSQGLGTRSARGLFGHGKLFFGANLYFCQRDRSGNTRLWLLLADISHTDSPPALNRQVATTSRMMRMRRLRWSRAKLGNNSLLVCLTKYSVIFL
jgi:hypothetical protein